MKTYLTFLICLALFFSACERDTEIDPDSNNETSINETSILTTLESENGFTYTESLEKWNALKELNGNSYTYQTTFLSWVGFGNTTGITVEDGEVTARTYEEFRTNDTTGIREITDSYAETIADLGSHEKGAALLTIDDLYSSCAGEYLVVDVRYNTIYFKTETNGLMTLCGFVPDDCADDCYIGISIDSFEWID